MVDYFIGRDDIRVEGNSLKHFSKENERDGRVRESEWLFDA